MEKKILMKAAAAVIGAAAVVTGAAIAVNHVSKNADSYRSILIYQVEGTAQIDRADTGVMNAAENLYLESGDVLTVSSDSYMRLRLDDDKYVMVEEDSVFSVEATGTKEDSKTRINLTQGTIINEIQNPLSVGSMYEVTTPNSIMAVRGTIFRVEILTDEKGEIYTKLSTFEGNVVSRLIFSDGTMDDEVDVGAGNEVMIHSNDTVTEYLGGVTEISYENLSLETLCALRDIMEDGDTIQGVTQEELEELIRRLMGMDESDDDGGTSNGQNRTQPERETSEAGGEAENLIETEPTTQDSYEDQAETITRQETRPKAEPEESSYVPELPGDSEEETTAEAESTTMSETVPETTREASTGSGGGGYSGGNRRPTSAAAESSSENPSESTSEPESESPSETTPEKPTEDAVYTVTFIYQGEEVGTQQVESGSQAMRPKLNPAADGGWDFDFSREITEDTQIQWN